MEEFDLGEVALKGRAEHLGVVGLPEGGLTEAQLFPFDELISTSAGHALIALGSLAAGDQPGFLERAAMA